MKVAMVTPFPQNPDLVTGGVEGVAVELSRALRAFDGVELSIVTEAAHGGFQDWEGIPVYRVGTSTLPGFISYWTVIRKRMLDQIERIDPDIVHFQGIAGQTLGCRRPFVLTVHGIIEKDIMYKGGILVRARAKIVEMAETLGRRRTNAFIIISPYVESILKGQIRGRVWPIENPIADEFFDVPSSAPAKNVLFCGTVLKRKNVLGLIRAFGAMTKTVPEAVLRIGGPQYDAGYLGECQAYVNENGLTEKVHFLGALTRARVLIEMGEAACVVLPSFQETAPLIVEEAMAAGVPVIASGICGLPYMIDDGKTGFLVDPRDEAGMAEKMETVLKNSDLRASMGAVCRATAEKRFRAASVAAATYAVYREILSGNR